MTNEIYTDLESESKLTNAVTLLREALKNDPDYYMSWQANIAMSFQDEMSAYSQEVIPDSVKRLAHQISNRAAEKFLNLLIS